MNAIDEQLNRLFRAVRQIQPAPVSAPAYGLETRVLAAWRAAQAVETGFWDMTLLLRGLIVAGVIMAVSLWPVLNSTETTTNPFAEYLQLADSTVPSDESP
jgi:hypothetical protein